MLIKEGSDRINYRFKDILNYESELKKVLKNNLDSIKEDIEKAKCQKADRIMYTSESSMSVVDPSDIYDKCIGGVRKPKLSKKIPKTEDSALELGFSKEGKCLYEKLVSKDILWATYVYKDNKIYRVYSGNAMYLEIYEFDQSNRIKFIQRGIQGTEKYQWLDNYVAIVEETSIYGISKLLMIKNDCEVLAIFELHDEYDMRDISQGNSQSIVTSESMVKYSHLIKNDKNTPFYIINCHGNEYIGCIRFMKPPKDFCYKETKELFKKLVLDYIRHQIQEIEFSISIIGILYKNEGYDINDFTIGFDDQDSYEVLMMKKSIDVDFGSDAIQIEFLNAYIQTHRYYNDFRKLIYQIKNELEKDYNVEVVLEEMGD